jgi:1-aminocyclopropane-1-carboxylate deaminase/D-cysteine desulfhydrase-like pyridoxal-dependent ACC family enzyme
MKAHSLLVPSLAIILSNRKPQSWVKKMKEPFYPFMSPSKVFIQSLALPKGIDHVKLSVLRTDLIDPVISGNKYFKLIRYLEEAISQKHQKVATFGGPFSNHLVAFARICQQLNALNPTLPPLEYLGVVRGKRKEGHPLSPTLSECLSYGMKLHFVDIIYNMKIKQDFKES